MPVLDTENQTREAQRAGAAPTSNDTRRPSLPPRPPGTDRPVDRRRNKETQNEPLSLPLYVSGLVVALAGIMAINSEVGNAQFSYSVVLLTVLGFVFSYAYRWMRLDSRYLHFFALLLAAGVGYEYLIGSFNVMALVPAGVELPPDLMMAVFLEWLLVIRSWMLISDGEVAFSAIFSVSIIGLVSVYEIDTTVVIDFLVYTIASVFLLIHQNYLVQRSWSGLRERRRRTARVIKAQMVIAAASGFLVLVVAAAIVTPIAALGSHLSLGGALHGLLFDYKGSTSQFNTNGFQNLVSFSDDPDFSIGTGPAGDDDSTVLLHVQSNDGQPRYWRGRAYDRYIGNAWVSSLVDPLAAQISRPPASFYNQFHFPAAAFTLDSAGLPGGVAALPPALRRNKWSPEVLSLVRVVNGRTDTLYAPAYPHQVIMPFYRVETFNQTRDGNMSEAEVSAGFWYFVTSYGAVPSPKALRASGLQACPPEIRRLYIDQLGDSVSPDDQARLSATAHGIVDSLPVKDRDEFDEAEQIRQWVSRQCTYSLSPTPTPPGEDSVSYFLFTSRVGYCDLFASSMAILCRYAGIPSRVVTGFDQGIQTQNGYDLRAMDKHAWVEVYFPGQGWYPFDPTVGTKTDSTVGAAGAKSQSPLGGLLSWLRTQLTANGFLPIVLFAVVLICLAIILKSELLDPFVARVAGRRGQQHLMSLSEDQAEAAWPFLKSAAGDRYRRMEQLLAQAGLARRPHWTPLEYERDLRSRLPQAMAEANEEGVAEKAAQALAAIEALTEDFVLSSYAPREAAAGRLLSHEQEHRGAKELSTLTEVTRSLRFGNLARAVGRRVLPKKRVHRLNPATEATAD